MTSQRRTGRPRFAETCLLTDQMSACSAVARARQLLMSTGWRVLTVVGMCQQLLHMICRS